MEARLRLTGVCFADFRMQKRKQAAALPGLKLISMVLNVSFAETMTCFHAAASNEEALAIKCVTTSRVAMEVLNNTHSNRQQCASRAPK